MRIGIDARLIEETGVGRYIRNLIDQLSALDTRDTFVIYLNRNAYGRFSFPANFEKRLADVHWHTVKEQLVMPVLFMKDRLDLVHVPYFNMPILYPGKFMVTIHDLTVMRSPTGKASTLPVFLYRLKRIGFQIILRVGLWRARHVIAVSDTTRRDLEKFTRVSPQRITVTYEGVDAHMKEDDASVATAATFMPYFLYVGNAYPHKNLKTIVAAFEDFRLKAGENYHLVFVGKEDLFYQRMFEGMKEYLRKWVLFFGPATDAQLASLYRNATALLFPSLREGFGLPALEAASFGCPLIVSDIPVFHEVLDELPVFVPVRDVSAWSLAMQQMAAEKTALPAQKVRRLLARYSWKTMAEKTLGVYRQYV